MNPVLSVRGLEKRFGAVVAADALSLDLAAGQKVSLIGANGAGLRQPSHRLSQARLRLDRARRHGYRKAVAKKCRAARYLAVVSDSAIVH